MSSTHRSLAPQEVSTEELTNVMWEVLRRFEEAGLDIGPEASELLKRKAMHEKHLQVSVVET